MVGQVLPDGRVVNESVHDPLDSQSLFGVLELDSICFFGHETDDERADDDESGDADSGDGLECVGCRAGRMAMDRVRLGQARFWL